MKRYLLLPALLLVMTNLSAIGLNNQTISGRVIDQNKKPVEFAVITLLRSSDSSLVKGGTADENGAFSMENIPAGNFILNIVFAGFEKYSQGPFDFTADSEMKLGDITLLPMKEMEEVTISATKPLFTQRADMLVMNVESSPVRIMGNAWDLLSTAPGVVVDQNNNITLRGKGGVAVYVDSRNTFLGGDQLVSYLQNISAADVVEVQIISNPSAKYDAEGTGGILNIITKKGSQLGFNGSVRAGYGQAFYSKYEGGANFNYAKEKFNIYGKYDFGQRDNLFRSFIDRNITYNGATTNFYQHSSMYSHPFGQTARLGIDLYGKHDITWGARLDGSLANEHNGGSNVTMITDQGNDSVSELYQLNKSEVHFNNVSGNLYFNQKYDTLGREFSASVDYLQYSTSTTDNFNLNYFGQNGTTIAPTEDQRSISTSNIRILVGQADYSHPFNKKYKLETGLKSSYVETANDLAFSNLVGATWTNDTTKSNAFIYKEQINAAYVNGYADLGKWQFMAGVRAEQTNSDGDSPTTGQHLARTYIQLFPSIFILQKIGKQSSINYTFSRRINRPAYDELNPFVFYLDKYTSEQGNPYLQPEISYEGEITYSFMDALFVTAAGGITDNAMTGVTNQIDSTGVGYKTTINLKRTDHAYFGLSCPLPIGNWFFMENEINVSYSHFNSEIYGTMYELRSWTFNPSTNLTFILPKDFKIQAWAWYESPNTYGIFKMKSKSGVGAGISKTFLHKQLQFNLNVQDIFSTNGMRADIDFQGQDVYLEFQPESPRVFLRVRYNFGNTKATRKAETKSGADELKNRTGK